MTEASLQVATVANKNSDQPISFGPLWHEPSIVISVAHESPADRPHMKPPNTMPQEQPIENVATQPQSDTIPEFYWDNSVVDHSLNGETTSEPSQSWITAASGENLKIKESIGTHGVLALIGGTAVSLCSISFLVFLWTGQGSSLQAVDAPRPWRAIVLGGWSTQAITLAALLIRTAVAAQATVCTAMLASLFLERRRVPKSDVAQFSVLRAINDGPLKLTRLVLKPRSRIFSLETTLIVILAVSSLALQFGSTILLSDLRELAIAADIVPVPVTDYVAGGGDYTLHVIDVTNHPQANTVFGELPHNASSDPDTKGFSATGPQTRAFLPLREPNNRTTIYSYSGNAAALYTNFACMRPNLQSSFYLGFQQDLGQSAYDGGRIEGTLHHGESLREARSINDLCDSEQCLTTEFNCILPGAYDEWPGWQSSLCIADVLGDSYWQGDYSLGWDSGADFWSDGSLVYLLLSTNMYSAEWNASYSPRALDSVPVTHFAEWSSYEIHPNRFINATLCFSAIRANLTSVDMVATGNLVEPSGNWSATGVSNSSLIRKWLGVSDKDCTHAERGILTIKNMQPPDRLSPINPFEEGVPERFNQTLAGLAAIQFEEAVYRGLAGYGEANATFQACTLCEFAGLTLHPELAAVIEDTIRETGRAADALQAYTTSIANTYYQFFLKAFNGSEDAHIAFSKTVQGAGGCGEHGCKGIISVTILLALHLVGVVLTTLTYVRFTRCSRQGNTWHAVSQLTGPELETTLRRGNDMSDKALAKDMKKEGDDVFLTLQKTASGRIEMISNFEKPNNIQGQ
jgi:hypothetical protein